MGLLSSPSSRKIALGSTLLALGSCELQKQRGGSVTGPDTAPGIRPSHLDISDFPSDVWVKEPGIRLDLDAQDPTGTVGFHTPFVFRFPDGTLRMYYDIVPTAMSQVVSATSTDGLNWTKESGIRLSGSDVGGLGAFHPHVLEASPGLYRMYFETNVVDIRSAVSSDGVNWAVEPGIRVGGGARDPVVLELMSGGYRMYFRTSGTSLFSAVSADGLIWTVESGTRITDAREFAAIRLPNSDVVIYYGKGTPRFVEILSARSKNGLDFIKDSGARLLPGGHPDSDPLDSGRVLTTSIVEFPGGVVRMYYQGSPTADINNPARVFSAVSVLFVTIQVAIDIKPGSDPNCFNNDGNGVIPVAILGAADFDVAQVDPTTVELEGLSVGAKGKSGKLMAHVGDVNGDGFDDLAIQIEDLDGTFASGSGTARLTGHMFDGTPFEGSDDICVVP